MTEHIDHWRSNYNPAKSIPTAEYAEVGKIAEELANKKRSVEPWELHQKIASGPYGSDKVTLTVLVQQIGSVSGILDRMTFEKDTTALEAERMAECADLYYHLLVLLKRWELEPKELRTLGEARFEERCLWRWRE